MLLNFPRTIFPVYVSIRWKRWKFFNFDPIIETYLLQRLFRYIAPSKRSSQPKVTGAQTLSVGNRITNPYFIRVICL